MKIYKYFFSTYNKKKNVQVDDMIYVVSYSGTEKQQWIKNEVYFTLLSVTNQGMKKKKTEKEGRHE